MLQWSARRASEYTSVVDLYVPKESTLHPMEYDTVRARNPRIVKNPKPNMDLPVSGLRTSASLDAVAAKPHSVDVAFTPPEDGTSDNCEPFASTGLQRDILKEQERKEKKAGEARKAAETEAADTEGRADEENR